MGSCHGSPQEHHLECFSKIVEWEITLAIGKQFNVSLLCNQDTFICDSLSRQKYPRDCTLVPRLKFVVIVVVYLPMQEVQSQFRHWPSRAVHKQFPKVMPLTSFLCRVQLTKGHRRLFFDATLSSSNNRKSFAEKKLIGFSAEQMYDVVSDVENYKSFVPFCKKSYVYDRRPGFLKGDLVIGFPPINERYTSNVTMEKPTVVRAECFDGVLFNYLLTVWKFGPGLKDISQSCVIDFYIDFEFKSNFHRRMANLFFDQIVKQMEQAFFQEARHRFGRPAIKSHVLVSGQA